MEKVNLEQVFDTLNEQRRNLNRCLGQKNNTYQQIFSKSESLPSLKKWGMISYLKTAQKLLSAEEYEKLWSLPKLRALAKVIENILYNLKYEAFFVLDADCFYLKYEAFENYAIYGKKLSTDFVLLPYKATDIQVYEFVISGVFFKSMYQSDAKNNAFIHIVDAEFIAGYYKNICFVVRIVPDILQDKISVKEIAYRYDCGLCFSSLLPRNIKFIQSQMSELRKRLMLWFEYKKQILFARELGDIGLVDMMEYYPNVGKYQWQKIFETLLVNKHVFSKKLWQKLAVYNIYEGVFNGMKMMLQKFSGNSNVCKSIDYFYFVDDTQRAAARIFWRKGWMAQVFVQSLENLEFPVLSNGFVYVVKTVKDLSKEPLLQELFTHEKPHYIWNSY